MTRNTWLIVAAVGGVSLPTSNRWTATVTSEAGQQWLTLTSATGETTRLRRER